MSQKSQAIQSAPISFAIQNAKAPQEDTNVIYMPCGPIDNKITLQISSNADLQLSTATPVEETGVGDATGSLFYLHVENLGLADGELEGLQVSLEGWTAKVYTDTKVICLAPSTDTTLSKGQSLAFSIGNLAAASSPPSPSARLHMDFYRAGPVSEGKVLTYNSIVALQALPQSGKEDLRDALSVSLSSGNIIVQNPSDVTQKQVENSLTLTLSGTTPVPAGPDTVLTIDFVYSEDPQDTYGYGALTTVGNADNIQVNPGNGVTGWTTKLTQQDSQHPAWTLKPSNGQSINGTTGPVDFDITKILTPFGSGSTLMIVSYRNVPDYNDGSFALVIDKESHVFINSFTADPPVVILDENGVATVNLSWDVWIGPNGTLTLTAPDTGNKPLSDDKGSYQWQSSPDAMITQQQLAFKLTATGKGPGNSAHSSLSVTVAPEFTSMSAGPRNVYYDDFNQNVDAQLGWAVRYSDTVTLSSSINGSVGSKLSVNSYAVPIKQPQMLSVTPDGDHSPLFIKHNAVISAFKWPPSPLQLVLKTYGVADIALSPTDNIYVAIMGMGGFIFIFDAITNERYDAQIRCEDDASSDAVSFSQDGKKLIVMASGLSGPGLQIFDVVAKNGSFSFTGPQVVKLDSNVFNFGGCFRIWADDSKIAATTGFPGLGSTLYMMIRKHDNSYAPPRSVKINNKGNFAVSPSARQIFLPDGSAPYIHIVGYDDDGNLQPPYTIGGFGFDIPRDAAVVGLDSGTLLISCQSPNCIYAVNINALKAGASSLDNSNSRRLTVSAEPYSLAAVESGAYACVANHDSTLSLLSCFHDYTSCRVVAQSMGDAVDTANLGITTSAQISPIYVGWTDNDGAGGKISVWQSQTFISGTPLSCPTGSSRVAASSKSIVSWHRYDAPDESATPGLCVSGKQVDGKKYTTFEFWPDDTQHKAVATVYGDNNLYVIDTDTANFSAVPTSFSSLPSTQAVATSVSRFGNMVFVLAASNGAHQLVAISCDDLKTNTFHIVSTVDLPNLGASGQALATMSDGSGAFVMDSASKKLYVISRDDKSGTYNLQGTSYSTLCTPQAMACAPDDSQLYIWMSESGKSGFAQFDIAQQELKNVILLGSANVQLIVTDMTLSPDGSRLYVLDGDRSVVRVFSTAGMHNVENIGLPANGATSVAIAPDGSRLFTANAGASSVSIFNQLKP